MFKIFKTFRIFRIFKISKIFKICKICNFFPERECIGNYTPNSWVVLTIDNFNTLLLYKEKNDIDAVLQDLVNLSEKTTNMLIFFYRTSSCRSGSAVSCV